MGSGIHVLLLPQSFTTFHGAVVLKAVVLTQKQVLCFLNVEDTQAVVGQGLIIRAGGIWLEVLIMWGARLV